MLKISSNIDKIFFVILLTTSLTVSADDPFRKLKWTVGSIQEDSSNPFRLIDPESILVTDPAYSAQDPVSVLLTDPAYGAQDPESIEIVTKIASQTYKTISKKEVIAETNSKDEIKFSKEKSVSLDSAGNTVTKTFKISTEVKSILVNTKTTNTTTRTNAYEDGSIDTKVTAIDVATNTVEKEISRTEIKKELIGEKVTPNVKKTWFTSKTGRKFKTNSSNTSSTFIDKKIKSSDENGSEVIDTYRTYKDTITTPTVVTITKTTTKHILWSDGKTTTSDMTTSSDTPVTNVVTTQEREEYVDRKVIPKIVSVDDTRKASTNTFKGSPNIESDCTIKEKNHKEDNKNIIIKISETCVNTVTTPVTTTKTIITKRNTLWTDGNITSKEIDVHKEESTINSTTINTTKRKLGSEVIEFKKLNQKESQGKLKGYLNNSREDPEKLTQLELESLANLICQKFKAQGLEFTQIPKFYDQIHNWNNPSGFEKLYSLIEKCLRY